jgi:hypothetical protein
VIAVLEAVQHRLVLLVQVRDGVVAVDHGAQLLEGHLVGEGLDGEQALGSLVEVLDVLGVLVHDLHVPDGDLAELSLVCEVKTAQSLLKQSWGERKYRKEEYNFNVNVDK